MKVDTRDHMVYDTIYVTCPEKAKLWPQKVGSVGPGEGPGGRGLAADVHGGLAAG